MHHHQEQHLSRQSPPSNQQLDYLNSYLTTQNYLTNNYGAIDMSSIGQHNYYQNYRSAHHQTYRSPVYPYMSQPSPVPLQSEKQNKTSSYQHVIYSNHQYKLQHSGNSSASDFNFQADNQVSVSLSPSPTDQNSLNTTPDNMQLSSSTESGYFSASNMLNGSYPMLSSISPVVNASMFASSDQADAKNPLDFSYNSKFSDSCFY